MRTLGRLVLALVLVVAGVGHFVATDSFLGQVPTWLPLRDWIVWISGVVELSFAAALVVARERRVLVGWLVAGLFVAVFPGNLWQYVHGSNSFGLDTDGARLTRLFFQPLLVAWALWCTGAWRAWRRTSPNAG